MDGGDRLHFQTKDEEILYWKTYIERLMNEKDLLQIEFDDFASNSTQLEKEYEATIDQNEKAIKDLRTALNRSQNDRENLQLKLEQAVYERDMLQDDIASYAEEKQELQKSIRLLEQKNDDLERNSRMITESIAAFKVDLNSAIEKNAILESEVEEKDSLKEKLQRLTDEARDLKHDLNVRDRCPDNERLLNGHAQHLETTINGGGALDSNRLKVECETQTPVNRPGTSSKSRLLERPLTPSSRVLALNIIGELMQKIIRLEAKVKQYRPDYRSSTESMSRRGHHSRGRTSPSLQTINK